MTIPVTGANHQALMNAIKRSTKLIDPPKREWVGLTDEEILKFESTVPYSLSSDLIMFALQIEAKLKEKNSI